MMNEERYRIVVLAEVEEEASFRLTTNIIARRLLSLYRNDMKK